MKIVNMLFFRMHKNTNYYVFQCLISKNLKKIEKYFFYHNILLSIGVKQSGSDSVEIIYIKRFVSDLNNDISEQLCEKFSFLASSFEIPTYSEYCMLVERHQRSQDVCKKIIEKLLQKQQFEILSESEYREHCERALLEMKNPIENKCNFLLSQNFDNQCSKDIVNEKELVFIGRKLHVYQSLNLRIMLIYKLLEKIFGSGEQDSIYFDFRSRGLCYMAVSGYYYESNLFITGIIGQYSRTLEEEVSRSIEMIDVSPEQLLLAKNRVMQDIKFSVFQYGELFATLSYNLLLEEDIDMKKIQDILYQISVEEVKKVLYMIKNEVRIKVN